MFKRFSSQLIQSVVYIWRLIALIQFKRSLLKSLQPGASFPLRQWCISLCFRFPLFPKNFLTPWKISQILPFPEIFWDFQPPKFLMTFFVIKHKFRIPLFSVFKYISPYFDFFTFPPTFQNFPPVFRKFTCFYTLYVFFISSYFYHDAVMHHTMHVGLLEVPAG